MIGCGRHAAPRHRHDLLVRSRRPRPKGGYAPVTTRVGLAIVGAGRMGITHAEALRDEPSVRVNAIVDPADPAREAALRAAPGAAAFADLDAAFAAGGIEAVLIAA